MNAEKIEQPTKKVYQSPKLIRHGKLEDLTQGAKGGGPDTGTLSSN
jgi:hypothetical protein